MLAVVQRVRRARVRVAGELVGAIGEGLLALVGVRKGDADEDARILAAKLCQLRIFEDAAGKMNRSVADVGGAILVVSQFTLCADLKKGRRPGFEAAEAPAEARARIAVLAATLRAAGMPVSEGRFGAEMAVTLVNQGPATFLLDTALWR